MKLNECRTMVIHVLQRMDNVRYGMLRHQAVETLCMIAAHESMRGKYRRQQGGGPARGLYQMERITHDTIWAESDTIKQVAAQLGYTQDFDRLEHDDEYATFVARHYLAMDRNPLPHNAVECAEYCKSYWNGPGKATANEYLTDYAIWAWSN